MTSQSRAVGSVPKPTELIGIQYLRGLAAMMVVVFHVEPQLRRMGYHGFWPSGLSGGVDLFFVISGFIMWVTTAGRKGAPLLFWRRRIARVVPLYWLATTVMVAVMLAAPRLLQTSRFELWHVVTSYMFVPWDHPVKHVLEPAVMPGWTLNYEMFFYLVFGMFLLAPGRWRLAGTIAVLAALVVAGQVSGPPSGSWAAFYSDDVILEFAGGMVLGWFFRRDDLFIRIPRFIGWAMVVLGLLYIATVPDLTDSRSRLLTMGLGATVAVAGMLAIEAHGAVPRWFVPRLIGDASYSIYLSQMVTMAAVGTIWRRLDPAPGPVGWLWFGAISTVVVTGVGVACYGSIERRLIGWFRPAGDRPDAARLVVPAPRHGG